jgi:hypothetical protein
MKIDPTPTFPSGILYLPLIGMPDLKLCQHSDQSTKPHCTSINRKGPIVSGFRPLIFYQLSAQSRTRSKGVESESPKEGYAWCLPWSKEGERLASVKLGAPSKSTTLGPILYNA